MCFNNPIIQRFRRSLQVFSHTKNYNATPDLRNTIIHSIQNNALRISKNLVITIKSSKNFRQYLLAVNISGKESCNILKNKELRSIVFKHFYITFKKKITRIILHPMRISCSSSS